MGNVPGKQPTNKTGKKVVAQKLDNAKKTGVLSLADHKLQEIPAQVFLLEKLTTLDLSNNEIAHLPSSLAKIAGLKNLNCDQNNLPAGSVHILSKFQKLQSLSLNENRLGRPNPENTSSDPLPTLPTTLKQLKLARNYFSYVPRTVLSAGLSKLEKLDLSRNQLATIPSEIRHLGKLNELVLDENALVSLPDEIGRLSKLKTLSMRNNHIKVHSTIFTDENPQPLPPSLFTDTPLIDLNLHGNPMTSTQLNEMAGFDQFLARREKVKTTGLYGGALTDLDVCGLK